MKHLCDEERGWEAKNSNRKAYDLSQCPPLPPVIRFVMSCPFLKDVIGRTKLSCSVAAWKLEMNFNTLANSSDSHTPLLFSKKIKVEFQVSSCVKSGLPETFSHYYFLVI